MKRRCVNFYRLLFLFYVVGFFWLIYNFKNPDLKNNLCVVKKVYKIPCPGCGNTRSILAFFSGNLKMSLFYNPFGFIIAILIVFIPVLFIMELILKKNYLFTYYDLIEQSLNINRNKVIVFMVIILNWIWNFYKFF
jgi:hypothetical protein